MAFSATQISLSPNVRQILEQIAAEPGPHKIPKRAKIILLAADGLNNGEIAKLVDLCRDTCSAWRVRFAGESQAIAAAAKQGYEFLEEYIRDLLKDDPRPGRPVHFTDEQVQRIRELAQKSPKDVGLSADTWSYSSLAKAAVKEGIVPSISAKTIWRYVQSDTLKLGDEAR